MLDLRVVTFVALLIGAGNLSGQSLQPRVPLDTGPVRAAPLPPALERDPPAGLRRQLIIKFADAVRGRATPTGDVTSRSSADLSAVSALARTHELTFSPLIRVSEPDLAALERRAATRSGVAQPDLAGIVVVHLPNASVGRLESVGQRLQDLPEVEFAHVQTLGVPPPGDIAPPTPDLTDQQSYLDPELGLDVDYAWTLGLRGAGVRLSDCEYGWNPDHEDLEDIDIHLEPGQTIDPLVYTNGYDRHGTAVVGQTSAVVNGYGVDGIAPDADVYTYTEWSVEEGFRRVTAITNAINDSAFGDVVLLEMQSFGAGGGLGPAELDPAVFTVVKVGTDAGVVVVAAAGNGDQDLDGPAYASYAAMGDSGAIIVGAGSSDGNHDKLLLSTYGSRVNLQGWGENVFTLGYGDFAQYGGDKNQRYTDTFNGTSSASPFVAGACCLLQQCAMLVLGRPLRPAALRQLLVVTGVPQGTGGHIGPFPDIRRAVDALVRLRAVSGPEKHPGPAPPVTPY